MDFDGKDDTLNYVEVNMGVVYKCPNRVRFPGVGDHGMHDTVKTRQPGRPCTRFHGWEAAPTTEIREAESIAYRESDRFILPMKAGNAAGGKEATHGRAS